MRRGTEADLPGVAEVWYRCEVEDVGSIPPLTPEPDLFRHDLERGELHVASVDGTVAAFSASAVRGRVRFLTELFVRPDLQERGLGRVLLDEAMPADGLTHATLSSRDPRAVALYARSGMTPRWPHFVLAQAEAPGGPLDARSSVAVVPAGEDQVEEWVDADEAVSGRRRPEDLEYWRHTRAASPIWFHRAGMGIGYGLIQLATPQSLWVPDGAHVGPLGVEDPGDLASCALAAVEVARDRGAREVVVGVPGPSPALPVLLDAGFRIRYVELFMASAEFFDPERYLASGSDLM
ncbi:MAG: GNAT family N-acetyltransferase [Actinobacteria bacterium]|nr:MAG: GNAT family N-acetyltransferase [Actinomycetota bacterium]